MCRFAIEEINVFESHKRQITESGPLYIKGTYKLERWKDKNRKFNLISKQE